MAAFVELYVDQGTTFTNTITLNDDSTNANVNISGYLIRSQMRRSYYSTNATANFVCTITDSEYGVIEMSLDAANTANIKAGRYVFDVEMQDTANVVTRILEGIITVTPGVTR